MWALLRATLQLGFAGYLIRLDAIEESVTNLRTARGLVRSSGVAPRWSRQGATERARYNDDGDEAPRYL